MKFNRELYIDSDEGYLDTALDCIEELVEALNIYFKDDKIAKSCGYYNRGAEKLIREVLKNTQIGSYLS